MKLLGNLLGVYDVLERSLMTRQPRGLTLVVIYMAVANVRCPSASYCEAECPSYVVDLISSSLRLVVTRKRRTGVRMGW